MPAGAASLANASSSYRPEHASRWKREWLLLLGAGVLAALLHELFRWPLKLPGHHGLEWLAVLMAARLMSSKPLAALAVALGAAATAMVMAGGHGPGLRPLIYLMQGLALDGLWLLLRGGVPNWWLAALMGAAVHALSPLFKLLLMNGGWVKGGVVASGAAFPVLTHGIFGALGAAAGALAIQSWQRKRQR